MRSKDAQKQLARTSLSEENETFSQKIKSLKIFSKSFSVISHSMDKTHV